jgi:hypothetical protein
VSEAWFSWGLVVVGGLLVWPLQWRIDAVKPPPPDIVDTLPPADVLPVLACGHGGAAANLLEIEAVNFLIAWLQGGHARLERDHLLRLYEGVVALDPNDPLAVERAAIFLWSLSDSPENANKLIDEALERVPEEHPWRWRLYREKAGIYLMLPNLLHLSHKDPEREKYFREAGRILLRGAHVPNMPPVLIESGERLLRRGLTEREALVEEGLIWARAHQGDPEVSRFAAERLLETQSAVRRLDLEEQDVRRFMATFGRLPRSLEELSERLGVDVSDPMGHGFLLADLSVYAPAQEARVMQRRLETNLRQWYRRHPEGPLPTQEQLGAALLPHLEVIIDEAGVRVVPRPLTPEVARKTRLAHLREERGRRERAYQIALQGDDPIQTEQALDRLQETIDAQIREQLQSTLVAYVEREGHVPADFEQLGVGLAPALGFGFIIADGWVVAPAVDARRLSRLMNGIYAARPNARRVHDLGLQEVPPWLSVAIDSGRREVVVQPQLP